MNGVQLIVKHEGFRATVYCDRCGEAVRQTRMGLGEWICRAECLGGNLTVGFGQRVDGAGLTYEQAIGLVHNKVVIINNELVPMPWFFGLSYARKAAIIDMAYCCGVDGVLAFKEMIAAIEARNWSAAADQIINSEFARGREARAHEDARIMRDGV